MEKKSHVRSWRRMAVVALALTAVGVPAATAWSSRSVHDGLQRDVNAIHAAGATGVLATVDTPRGEDAARAGVADLETGAPVPWDGYFRIGSISKSFTATVALQLVGEGRLGLTDPVEQWLPGLVQGNGNDGSRITLTNLLRHTSGLNDYDGYLPWAEDLTPEGFRAERFHAYQPDELVTMALQAPPIYQPDPDDPAGETRWSYSNTNYVLAMMIIEAATGNSWEQEIHDRIIEPLGLRHTFTAGTSAYVPRPRANAYTRFPGQADYTETSIFAPLPDAPIISTTADITTFLRALLGGRLLRPAQLAAMQQTVEAREIWDTEPGTMAGLGLYWRPVAGCGGGVWSHGGTMPGLVSEAAATADGRRAAVVATSTWSFDDDQEARDEATRDLINHALCRDG